MRGPASAPTTSSSRPASSKEQHRQVGALRLGGQCAVPAEVHHGDGVRERAELLARHVAGHEHLHAPVRNAVTSRFQRSACSRLGTWPQRSKTTARASGMRAASSSA